MSLSALPTRLRSPVHAGIAVAALVLGTVPGAAQQDGMNWVRFPGQTYEPSTTDATHIAATRALMKEWESQPPKGFPTLGAQNLAAMKSAIQLYEGIVKGGGFPQIPSIERGSGLRQYTLGLLSPVVGMLKHRLALSGDLREQENDRSTNFDYALEKAVKRFQASNGLTPTGVVDQRTVDALNVPAQARLAQLQTNYKRLTDLAKNLPKKYILVNIPAQQIEAVEGTEVFSRHAGVVGKTDRQSPVLRSSISQLNFNPVWHLPPTVISKDLIPKAIEMQARGQDAFAKYGIDVFGADGKKLDTSRIKWTLGHASYSFKQQPGPENPLGFVKLNFPNNHSTYMHSTPSETLFSRNFRAASSGCVRVAAIEVLAEWILRDQGGWPLERIIAMKKNGERVDVNLKKPVPLYWAYITAWATSDGVIQFRRDLYEKDGVGAVAANY